MSRSTLLVKSLSLMMLVLAVGCTREMPKPARMVIQLPAAQSFKAQSSQKISALGAGSTSWGVSDPVVYADISCYAVVVEGPEPTMSSGSCLRDSDSTVYIKPGVGGGAYPAGGTIELIVPAGTSRRVALIGFAASNAGACSDFKLSGGPQYSLLSAPFVISETTLDLQPGTTQLTMFASLSGAVKLKDCTGFGGGTGSGQLPAVSISDVTGNEGTANTFLVSLTSIATNDVVFNYQTSPVNATASLDYSSSSGVMTIPTGAQFANLPATFIDDAAYEPNETFTMSLSSVTGAVVGKSVGIATIIDNDTAPSLSILNATTTEGQTAQFVVSLSALSFASVTFNYQTFSGSAATGTDLPNIAGTGTIAAGATQTTVKIPTLQDSIYEGAENFTVSLMAMAGASPGSVSALGTINDDDVVPAFNISSVSVSEAATQVVLNISLTNLSSSPTSVSFSTFNSTAIAGSDYVSASSTVSISAGSNLGSITISLIGDNVVEGNEAFTVSLSGSVGATLGSSDASVTIIDDDVTLPALSISDAVITEGGTAQLTISQNMIYGADTTVNYSTISGTAISSVDFVGIGGFLTIPAGQTLTTLSISSNEDSLYENSETLTLSLSSPANATISDGTGQITINDNDSPPTISVYNSSSVESGMMIFVVSLSGASGLPVTASYTTPGSGTAMIATDYAAASGSLSIAAGATSTIVSVSLNDDSTYEPNEYFDFLLSSPTGATVGTASATGTIFDNDSTPSISIADISLTEGGTALALAIQNTISGYDSVLTFTSSSGTATDGVDYVSINSIVTIAAGQTIAQVPVWTNDDGTFEGSETFAISLSNPVNVSFLDNLAIVTLNDNDPGPAVSIYDSSITEGGSIYFTISFSTTTVAPASLQVQTTPGSATSGTDFTPVSATLSIAPGTNVTQIYVATVSDSLFEGNENFLVSLSNLNLLDPADLMAVGTINDDDSPPTINISNPIVTEGSTLLFVASLSAPAGVNVSFNFNSYNGTAQSVSDYDAVSGTTMIFAGQSQITLAVNSVDDITYEYSEGFALSLSALSNATPGIMTGFGTINDDDPAPNLYISDLSISESSTLAMVAVTQDSVSDVDTTFYYAMGSGSATPGSDYFTSSGSMTISAGQTSTNIAVVIANNSTYELSETFNVSLTSSSDSNIVDPIAIVTIVDDDPAPIISIGGASSTEGGVLFASVSLSASSDADAQVNYQTYTYAGGASPGVDFTPANGSLSIAAGSTVGWITIPTFDDSLPEAQESFIISLSSATNSTIGTNQATFFINDNEVPPTISVYDALAVEGETLQFLVSLNYISGANITFNYQLFDQSAVSGVDFSNPGMSSFTVPAGVSIVSIQVPSVDDIGPEHIESFALTISSLIYAQPGLISAKGTILNDDKFSMGWSAGTYFKASNVDINDNYGYSVAVTDTFVAVAAPLEDSGSVGVTNGSFASLDNTIADAGAVYVYGRSGTTWVREAYLKPPDSTVSDNFGIKIAASGDTIVVGSSGEDSNASGVLNGTAGSANVAATNSGAAFIFQRFGATWVQQAYLKAADTVAADAFGSSLAIDGNTVVVGANLEDSNATGVINGTGGSVNATSTSAGAAYVFGRSGSSWSQIAYLKGATSDANDQFGTSVAVSRNQIVVGAPNESSNVATVTNGTVGSTNNASINAGAAYVFKGNGSSWVQSAFLKASNVASNQKFGMSVAIFADTAVIGAPFESSNQSSISNGTGASTNTTATNSGAAYVYKNNTGTWAQTAYLKAPNAEATDNFGGSVSIWGDRVAVGAYGEDSMDTLVLNGLGASADNTVASAGAVYLFERSGSTWTNGAFIKPPRAQVNMNFGMSVDLLGDFLVVGAPYESSSFNDIINGPWAAQDTLATGAGASFGFEKQGNPLVIIEQAQGQTDPALSQPINFTIEFSKPINPATFTTADIVQTGTATAVVWSLSNPSGDNRHFNLAATSGSTGTYIPTISAGTVSDVTGATNLLSSTNTDNKITY